MATPTSNTVPYADVYETGILAYDALLGGTKWGDGALGMTVAVTYSFPGETSYWASDYYDGEPWSASYAGFNALQKAAAEQAMAALSNVSGLTFNKVVDTQSTVGEIRFAWTEAGGEQAHAYYPGGYAEAGDVWLNASADWSDFAPGSYDYLTLIHELGHALGLKHTFSGNAALPTEVDSLAYSVMSYTTYTGMPDSWADFYPTTPMSFDIAAIQYLYGANTTHHAGDDIYTFNQGQHYFETLWDAGGKDTIVWKGSTESAEINLRPGAWSDLGNSLHYYDVSSMAMDYLYATDPYTVMIYVDTIIENATGGAAADRLIGNAVANTLNGGAGNDTLEGGRGNDIYIVAQTGDRVVESGGAGTDTVRSTITYTLPANVEKLILTGSTASNGNGNGLANTLTGNGAANVLKGAGGADKLIGGKGNDVLSGGLGNDTLSGGSGLDYFVFNTTPSGTANRDLITDFISGTDHIRIDDQVFTAVGALGAFKVNDVRFHIGAAAHDASDRIIYNASTGALYYDADGTGAAVQVQFAILGATASMAATDLIVV